MRRLSGEKTGLKIGLLINSCVLFFFFSTSPTFCQIPINRFCSLKTFQIPDGYQNIVSADIDFDNSDELIIYSPNLKTVSIISFKNQNEIKVNEIRLLPEITQLRELKESDNKTKYLVAVERKLRKVSLLTASNDSSLKKIGEIIFDSFPEKISSGDIDLNGREEILVCGSGFDGLSILFRAGSNLGEKKIASGSSFSEAVFIDFNYDGYLDILAFNILENSLEYYFNNTRGDFRLKRTIQYPERINFLQTLDLNKDGLQDIVFSLGKQIEIIFGDYQSSYEKVKKMELDELPLKIQFGYFNLDGIWDLVYLTSKQELKIHFGKNESDFHEVITYLALKSFNTFTKFRHNSTENLVCLSETGQIKIIASINELEETINFVPAIKVGAIKEFDYMQDDIPDISFIDEHDEELKLLLNNEEGIPLTYYSFPLVANHSEILVDEFFKRRKIFYCYSKGEPLIEVFRYNFFTNKLYRKQLYAPGGILDVSLQRIDSTLVNVFLVYNKNSRMYLGKFENRDLSVTFKEYPFIDRDVLSAEMFIKENPVIYYWKTENDSMYFDMVEVKTGPNLFKNYFKISDSLNVSANLFAADYYNSNYPSLVSVVQDDEKSSLIVVADDVAISNKMENLPKNQERVFKWGFFGSTSIKGLINFTVNTENDNYIYKLVFSETENKYKLRTFMEADNLSDYFFARFDQKNYYLLYSNQAEGYLSIQLLKK